MNWYLWALSNQLEHYKRLPLIIEWWIAKWRVLRCNIEECIIFLAYTVLRPLAKIIRSTIVVLINIIRDLWYIAFIIILLSMVLLI